MGLLEKKSCNICGAPIGVLGGGKLKDGYCCKSCEAKLSPWFSNRKTSSVREIAYQISCREQNIDRFRSFKTTRAFGYDVKVLVDDDTSEFMIKASREKPGVIPDVFALADVTNCTVEIVESREEIKFQDNNNSIKSFSPPCYACSYDFFVEICLNVPYINTVRLKLNPAPVDNAQETLITMNNGGWLGRVRDAIGSEKSYNGKTTNAGEVRASAEYKKYTLSVGDAFMDVVHENPDLTMHLTLFHARVAEGTPQLPEHNDLKWITVQEIRQYTFCPADEVILRRLEHDGLSSE